MPPLLADFTHARVCKPFCEKFLTLPTRIGVKYFLYQHRDTASVIPNLFVFSWETIKSP